MSRLAAALLLCAACGGSPSLSSHALSLRDTCAPLDPCPGATAIDGEFRCTEVSPQPLQHCSAGTLMARCHCAGGVVEAAFPFSAAACLSVAAAWAASVCGH